MLEEPRPLDLDTALEYHKDDSSDEDSELDGLRSIMPESLSTGEVGNEIAETYDVFEQ